MDKIFKTSDLPLAAFIALSYPVERIEQLNPKRSEFIFKSDENLNKLVSDYLGGVAKVEPYKFYLSIKTLKGRIYERREDGTARS